MVPLFVGGVTNVVSTVFIADEVNPNGVVIGYAVVYSETFDNVEIVVECVRLFSDESLSMITSFCWARNFLCFLRIFVSDGVEFSFKSVRSLLK